MKYRKAKPVITTTVAPEPEKKTEDDSLNISINVGLKDIFDPKVETETKKKSDSGEDSGSDEGSYESYRIKKTTTEAPKVEKKEFDIKIPNINVEEMFNRIQKENTQK